jgi:Fe-S cluster biogenesis protein NfuA
LPFSPLRGLAAAFSIAAALYDSAAMTSPAPTTPDRPLRERVAKVINLIRPAVQSDGGDVELVDVTQEGVVRIRLHGACVGCPSSTITLQVGIERNLKAHIPEVTTVEAVE